jgi:hypothetical protein
VTFRLHADRASFTGVDLRRIVEPGEISVMVGASSQDVRLRGSFQLTGDVRACRPRAGATDAGNGDASQLTQRRRRAP